MTKNTIDKSSHDFAAFVYSALAAAAFSLVPVLVDISAVPGNSLTVGAGVMLGFLLFSEILRRYRQPRSRVSYASLILRIQDSDASRASILSLATVTGVATLSYLALAWSTTYIDTAVSAAMFEF